MDLFTPVGIGTENHPNRLTSGTCGIGDITKIDGSGFPVKTTAEVAEVQRLPAGGL